MGWLLTLFGTLLSARGQYQQGKQVQATNEYNARVDEAEAKAENAAAVADEESLRREQADFFGRQRAAMAESGGMGGSLGLLSRQSEVLAELDALNVRHGGQLRGVGLLSQAQSRRVAGRSAASEGRTLAGAELLRGGADSLAAYRMR